MHPLRFPMIADENIHEEVVYFLRQQGLKAESIKERNLQGSSDRQIVDLAIAEEKTILTHDSDFGKILYTNAGMQTGVIFLRPGHIDYNFEIQTLQTLLNMDLEIQMPFMLVADRGGDAMKVRLRPL